MALITRVSRLFQADFHAVLDRIEEPDLLLRQAVREMEEELARDEQRIDSIDTDTLAYTVSLDSSITPATEATWGTLKARYLTP